MGNTPSEIRRLAKANNSENEDMANDALNTMGAIAREKMKNFRLKVISNSESHEVPIDKLIYQNQMICCSVQEDDKNIKNTVKDLIQNIATGKYIDALTSGSTAILNALFGSMVGNEGEHSFYRIVVGPLGGIRRVDVNLYMWAFSSSTLLNLTKNILVVSAVVSSVDVKTLDISTLRVAIEQTCGEDIDMGKKLLNDVLLEWRSEQKFYSTGLLATRYLPDVDHASDTRSVVDNDDNSIDPVPPKRQKLRDTDGPTNYGNNFTH